MQRCVNCGHLNRAGIVFCENCGASLIGKMPLDTKSLESSTEDEQAQMGVDSSVIKNVQVQGMAEFVEGTSLRLDIEGSPEPILFKPKAETIFGRRDPATGAMPDVDLTPFAGYRMGVSRRHAAIRFGETNNLDLWDLGSSNGTFLNGDRLNAHRPYRLHDGDEIRLGEMMIRVYFQPPGAEDKEPQAADAQEGDPSSKSQVAPTIADPKDTEATSAGDAQSDKQPAAGAELPAAKPAPERPAASASKPPEVVHLPPPSQPVSTEQARSAPTISDAAGKPASAVDNGIDTVKKDDAPPAQPTDQKPADATTTAPAADAKPDARPAAAAKPVPPADKPQTDKLPQTPLAQDDAKPAADVPQPPDEAASSAAPATSAKANQQPAKSPAQDAAKPADKAPTKAESPTDDQPPAGKPASASTTDDKPADDADNDKPDQQSNGGAESSPTPEDKTRD